MIDAQVWRTLKFQELNRKLLSQTIPRMQYQTWINLTRSDKVPEKRRIRFRFSFKFGRNRDLNRPIGAGLAGGGENGLSLTLDFVSLETSGFETSGFGVWDDSAFIIGVVSFSISLTFSFPLTSDMIFTALSLTTSAWLSSLRRTFSWTWFWISVTAIWLASLGAIRVI